MLGVEEAMFEDLAGIGGLVCVCESRICRLSEDDSAFPKGTFKILV